MKKIFNWCRCQGKEFWFMVLGLTVFMPIQLTVVVLVIMALLKYINS